MPSYKGLSRYELDQKFTEEYCKENKLFGLIEKNGFWVFTGIVTAFIFACIGAFVDESTTLGYIGFVIGGLVDYFMRKEYHKQLKLFQEGRSVWNGRVYNEED